MRYFSHHYLIIRLVIVLVLILGGSSFYHFGLKLRWFALPAALANTIGCTSGLNSDGSVNLNYCPTTQKPVKLLLGVPTYATSEIGLLDSVNTLVSWGIGSPQPALFKKFQKENKTLAVDLSWLKLAPLCGIDTENKQDITQGQMANCTTQTADAIQNIYNHGYNAVTFDEFLADQMPNFYSSIADGIAKAKQANPGKLVLVFGGVTVPIDGDSKIALGKLIGNADYYMPEIYLNDNISWDDHLIAYYNDKIGNLQNTFTDLGDRMIIILAAEDLETENFDKNPQVDWYKYLDREFGWTKGKINQSDTSGIGIFHTNAISPETHQWLAKLFNHYFAQNKDTLYSDGKLDLSFIKNSGFETNSDWVLTPGSGGEISYKTITELNLIKSTQYFGPRIPEGNQVLYLKRGTTANLFRQGTDVLTPGKNYKLEIFSKKISGDYGKTNIKTEILDANNQPIDYQYIKNTYYPMTGSYSYPGSNITLNACQSFMKSCTDKNDLWTKQELIFTAPVGRAKISVNDVDALPGEESVVDFAQLQEYSPLVFTKTVDKLAVSPGDTLTYRLKATHNSNIDNLNLIDAIPAGTTYVSATASRPPGVTVIYNSTNKTLTWHTNQLLAGTTLDLSFQVKVN